MYRMRGVPRDRRGNVDPDLGAQCHCIIEALLRAEVGVQLDRNSPVERLEGSKGVYLERDPRVVREGWANAEVGNCNNGLRLADDGRHKDAVRRKQMAHRIEVERRDSERASASVAFRYLARNCVWPAQQSRDELHFSRA